MKMLLIQKTTYYISKLKEFYKKEKNYLVFAVIMGFVFTTFFMFATNAYSETIQTGIASEVIRFHVLANSDSEADQSLKLLVRDKVLEQYKSLLNSSKSLDETKEMLHENLEDINNYAQEIIWENGFDYSVKTEIAKSIFPTKTYGDISFPAGEYEALRIIIGEGEGKNWWCLMFPPLCFVDVSQKVTSNELKEDLKNILTDEEYNLVINADSDKDMPIKVKFKVVEWWQEMKTKSMYSK